MRLWGIATIGLSLALGGLAPLRASGACGDAEKASAVYQAFQACKKAEAALATRKTPDFNRAIRELSATPYCALFVRGAAAAAANRALCADPNGTLCRYKGNLMDSACNIDIIEAQNADKVPAAVEASCRIEEVWRDFSNRLYPKFERTSCQGKTEADCKALFNLTYAHDRARIERDVAYPQEKIDTLEATLSVIKTKYLQLIEESKTIPASSKKYLKDKVSATHLELSEGSRQDFLSDDGRPDCYNTTPGSPPNTNLTNAGGAITVCIGQMYTLDNLNPYLLMHLMAHEIAHSLDPCAVERDAFNGDGLPKGPAPNLSATMFPGLLQCLRGGKGAVGCQEAVLHCTSEEGITEECGDDAACRARAAAMPSCWWNGTDTTMSDTDSSDYRHKGAAIEQIGESFADFMGAEVVGRVMKDDDALAKDPARAARTHRDALTAITSEFSRLHGTCLDENTRDEHPPGFLRVNRVIMSNEAFRTGMGCGGGPPKTKGADLTCHGF